MSSTILTIIVLVVMWLVVLVPMFVRRGEDHTEVHSSEPVDGPVRVLDRRAPARRFPTRAAMHVPTAPVEPAPPAGLDDLLDVGDDQPEPRARMLARRRRTLATLLGLTVLTLLVVALSRGRSGAWFVQLLCDLMFASYLIGLRREVRRERVRRAVRLARLTAARARASARRTVRATTPTARPPHPSPQRPVALDDQDPSFAELDYRHRRVVGG